MEPARKKNNQPKRTTNKNFGYSGRKRGKPMKISILDEILADPSYTLSEVVDIIDFHLKDIPDEVKKEVEDDLKHAFS